MQRISSPLLHKLPGNHSIGIQGTSQRNMGAFSMVQGSEIQSCPTDAADGKSVLAKNRKLWYNKEESGRIVFTGWVFLCSNELPEDFSYFLHRSAWYLHLSVAEKAHKRAEPESGRW